MKKELIIVPDVHGRTFWKEAVPQVEAGAECIFLGDYIDPYPQEGISDREAVENFGEIISFAQKHSDRVTLLLGNHDLSYFGREQGMWMVYADRFSTRYADSISRMLNDNAGLFSLCTCRTVGGQDFLFSHAGMHPDWIKWCGLFDDLDQTNAQVLVDRIEGLASKTYKADERTELIDALAMVGTMRGGDYDAGSMVWADCREYYYEEGPFTQIFGHTWMSEPYVVGTNICLDCQQCFFLDGEGQLHCIENVIGDA